MKYTGLDNTYSKGYTKPKCNIEPLLTISLWDDSPILEEWEMPLTMQNRKEKSWLQNVIKFFKNKFQKPLDKLKNL